MTEAKTLRQKPFSQKYRPDPADTEILRYGEEILRSDIMEQAFRQTHHRRCTVGDHTLRVARTSVRISHVLQRLHIRVDLQAVVIGSLCHDLGIIGRADKYSSVLECYRNHPADSVETARELLGDLPEGTAEIIRRHMWPLTIRSIPASREGFIVSAADKYSALVDLFRGSTDSLIQENSKWNQKKKKER